jgi:hypothetical protein
MYLIAWSSQIKFNQIDQELWQDQSRMGLSTDFFDFSPTFLLIASNETKGMPCLELCYLTANKLIKSFFDLATIA